MIVFVFEKIGLNQTINIMRVHFCCNKMGPKYIFFSVHNQTRFNMSLNVSIGILVSFNKDLKSLEI